MTCSMPWNRFIGFGYKWNAKFRFYMFFIFPQARFARGYLPLGTVYVKGFD